MASMPNYVFALLSTAKIKYDDFSDGVCAFFKTVEEGGYLDHPYPSYPYR